VCSDEIWNLFPNLIECFKHFGYDFLNEIGPCLENYIHYGGNDFFAKGGAPLVFELCAKTINVNTEDRDAEGIIACRLLITMFQTASSGLMHGALEPAITLVMSRFSRSFYKYRLKPRLLQVILACFYYDSVETLNVMSKIGVVEQYFALLLQDLKSQTFVVDKAYCSVGLTSLFKVPLSHLPPYLRNILPQIWSSTVDQLLAFQESLETIEAGMLIFYRIII
jgi:hypothetical protein